MPSLGRSPEILLPNVLFSPWLLVAAIAILAWLMLRPRHTRRWPAPWCDIILCPRHSEQRRPRVRGAR